MYTLIYFPGRWRTIDAEDLIITNKVISQELTGTFSRGKRIEDIYNYLAEFCVQPAFPTPRSEVSIYHIILPDISLALSEENNFLNDYSAKMALGLLGKTWWRFSSYSIVYRGR